MKIKINKYLDYQGLIHFNEQLSKKIGSVLELNDNILTLKNSNGDELSNVELAILNDNFKHNILDNCVEDYLKNVHYKNYKFNESFISDYALGSQLKDKYIECTILFSKSFPDHFFILFKSGLPLEEVDTIELTAEYSKKLNNEESITIKNVIPNDKYYWAIIDFSSGDPIIKENGIIGLTGSRMFYTFSTAYNVRDLGGIPTNSGLQIKFGKLIRGSEYSDADLLEFQELSFPYDAFYKFYFLDLRNAEDMGYHFEEHYHNSPLCTYSDINENTSLEKKEILADAINYVLNKVITGHSVYFHCKWGAHRTGLLSSILLSLLDVPQCEIDKDYELTSFDKDYAGDECLQRNDDIRGYKSGNEYIRDNYNSSWKNYAIQELGISEEKIEAFKDEMIIDYVREQNIVPMYFETTYEKLKNMKDRGVLTPGAHYRMIDYETIIGSIRDEYYNTDVSVVDATSANHCFDLIVKAISSNELSPEANAIHSARDTEGYFKDIDLSKWKIWYDINPDINKYNWVAENSKGVIYRMIDERGNDCPYDFKNILFDGQYTFNYTKKTNGTIKGTYCQYPYDMDLPYETDRWLAYNISRFTIYKTPKNLVPIPIYFYLPGPLYTIYVYKDNELIYSGPGSEDRYILFVEGGHEYRCNCMYYGSDGSMNVMMYQYVSLYDRSDDHKNAKFNIIKPWYKSNTQCLNVNKFIALNESDNISNNKLDYNCRDNKFSGVNIDNYLGQYCYLNEIESSQCISFNQSVILSKVKNSYAVTFEGMNTNCSINSCKNVKISSYKYDYELSGEQNVVDYIGSYTNLLENMLEGQNVISYRAKNKLPLGTLMAVDVSRFDGAKLISHEYNSGTGKFIFDRKLTKIQTNAFYTVHGLLELIIPDSIITIEREGIWAPELETINLPKSLKYVYNNSVYSYQLPVINGVKYIGVGVSFGAMGTNTIPGVTSVIFMDSTEFIAPACLDGLQNVTSVVIPSSIKTIGSRAFYSNLNLTSITIHSLVPPTIGSQIIQTSNPPTIYVPASVVDTYKVTPGWDQYSSNIEAIQQ